MPTEVLTPSTFYAQIIGDGVKQLETLMADFARYHANATAPADFTPRKGELVSAKFSEDQQW